MLLADKEKVSIVDQCKMLPLACNIEGLRTHSIASNLFGLAGASDLERRWRTWLVHCLVKAGRHYNEAREIVISQIEANRHASNVVRFPIFDFALAMEDCITSIEKSAVCLNALAPTTPALAPFASNHTVERKELNAIRRQQEHMHLQVAKGETGNGPILLTLTEDGAAIRLRDLKMPLTSVHTLIGELYRVLCGLYPNFDADSAPKEAGTLQLSMEIRVDPVVIGTSDA